ncbi:hypothetical protein ILUMI_02814 [Ignelater luminosus]|uniref:Gem-associated protein 5 n=1 Tax=Ignelater luminosus TaxID=2038154 RepID=A0A8K0DHJ9_IGNLU|nr:hypothetical protein ILUMI_02814 [Ignelater luminosus]
MNKLIVPPPPNWFEANILSCAPDNTVIYGSRNDVVIIYPKPEDEPADIKVINRCHQDKVTTTAIGPNWDNPDKLALSLGADKVISLLDIANGELKRNHSGHRTRSEKVAGATFAGYDKIVSVSEDGFIIIWKWVTNELKALKDLLGPKTKVTCLSACPHAPYMIAFGLKKGGIILADLRKSGRVLHKMRGHDSGVLSLTWCPVPYNVLPEKIPKQTRDAARETIELKMRSDLVELRRHIATSRPTDDCSSVSLEVNVGRESVEEAMNRLAEVEDNSITSELYAELHAGSGIMEGATNNVAEADGNSAPIESNIEEDTIEGVTSSTSPKIDVESKSVKEAISSNTAKDDSKCASPESNTDKDSMESPESNTDKDSTKSSESNADKESIKSAASSTAEDNGETGVQKETENIEINNTAEQGSSSASPEAVGNKETDSKPEVENANSTVQNNTNVKEIKASECGGSGTTSFLPELEHLITSNNGGSSSAALKKLDESHGELRMKEDSEEKALSENTELDDFVMIQTKDDHSNKTQSSPSRDNLGTSLANGLGDEVKKEPKKEYLLASCARSGKSIMIWRALTDGIKHVELNLPNRMGFRNKNRSQFSDDKLWITLCWVAPKILLSSSSKGELLYWNFYQPSVKGSFKWRLIHNDHYKCLFSIAAPIKIYETIEDGDNVCDSTLNAWTVGRDRLILNTSLSNERKTLALYPTIAASASCFASSPTYPNRIAVGGGEGVLRIWDLSRPHTQYINMTQMCDRKFQKITSLTWHPTKDTLLAFGTYDGRVGLIDPCGKKTPIYLVQFSNSSIHRLEWGPFNGDRQNFMLYTATNGKLIGYDTEKLLDAPTVFDLIDDVSHMSWKPDYSVCAVATKAGHVYLYTTELKLITTFYIQHKAVHYMAWHPQATVEDEDTSPYANWLAVGTNDVTVYDCTLTDDCAKEPQEISDRVVAVFKGHSKIVESLSWSTFEGGKLASAGCDGIAMVWDVRRKILLHTCGPFIEDSLLTVLWSPLDSNYIITGSKNSIIHIWKLSEHPPVEKIAIKKIHRKPLPIAFEGSEHSNVPSTSSAVDDDNYIEKIEKPKKSHRKYVLSGLIDAQNHNLKQMLFDDCKRLFTLHYGDGIIEDAEETNNGISRENLHIDVIKIFGNEQDLEELFDLELRYHSRNSRKEVIDGNTHISLWRGDVGNGIKHAIKTKTLTEWSVSMAPTVSHELYLEACEAYAKQLSEDANSNSYKVASYYLACHKIEQAINTLCASKNYLEAYVLAKCRLVSTDVLISDVLLRWAEYSVSTGSYEIAAQCYIVLHRLEDAVKILSRRTDPTTLKFCAKIAKHYNYRDMYNALSFRLSVLHIEGPKELEVLEEPLLTRIELEIQQNLNKNGNVDENGVEDNTHASSKLLNNTKCVQENDSEDENDNEDVIIDVEN